MVGLVLVSHSRKLSMAVMELAKKVTTAEIPVVACGGVGGEFDELGTDATDIMSGILEVYSDDGVVVLVDLGSAILSAKMAIELLAGEVDSSKILIAPAPIVEGAVSAAVSISTGATLNNVYKESVGALTAKQEALPSISFSDDAAVNTTPDGGKIQFTIKLLHGLHARPAAILVKSLALYKSAVTAQNITRKRGPVNAKSINKVTTLGFLLGDTVEFTVKGEDSAKVIDGLRNVFEGNFGEPVVNIDPQVNKTGTSGKDIEPVIIETQQLECLSEGVAIGNLYIAQSGMAEVYPSKVTDTELEIKQFDKAIADVQDDIEKRGKKLLESGHIDEAAIFDAHLLILNDADLLQDVKTAIKSSQQNAAYLYKNKMTDMANDFRNLSDPYLRERALDIVDVAGQVINRLLGKTGAGYEYSKELYPDGVVLVSNEVTPSMLSHFDSSILKGIITEKGGRSSHVAILARTLGIPAVAGIQPPKNILNGTLVAINAKKLEVVFDPKDHVLLDYKSFIDNWEKEQEQNYLDTKLVAVTTDNVKIKIQANISDHLSAEIAVKNSAEGVGLLRTEFLYSNERVQPSEDKQYALLKNIIQYFPNNTVTVRTIDIGGDKPIEWLKMKKEDNPFLGVRGIRLCQEHQGLFNSQLKAILRAAYGFDVRIMIPMISTVEEVNFSREQLNKAHDELVKSKIEHQWPVKLGIMIETPAAVVMADKLAPLVDFFSIGTNDLTQYVMAAERGSITLNDLQNPFQPAVLRMVCMIASAAKKAGIDISVCGEMAGNADTAKLLLGFGITSLSMSPSAIGKIKRAVIAESCADLSIYVRKFLDSSTLAESKSKR